MHASKILTSLALEYRGQGMESCQTEGSRPKTLKGLERQDNNETGAHREQLTVVHVYRLVQLTYNIIIHVDQQTSIYMYIEWF